MHKLIKKVLFHPLTFVLVLSALVGLSHSLILGTLSNRVVEEVYDTLVLLSTVSLASGYVIGIIITTWIPLKIKGENE